MTASHLWCMEWTNFWHRIAAQDRFTTFHNSSAFLGFASWTEFFMSAHKFPMGLRSRDCAADSNTSILFVWNQGFAHLMPCLGSLSCSMCSLAIYSHFSTCLFLGEKKNEKRINIGTLQGLLAGSLASRRRRLIVTVLAGNLRSSLMLLELIIGWAFVILVALRSIPTVPFLLFPHLSGFWCHFSWTAYFLLFFIVPSLVYFFKQRNTSSEQCLERPIFSVSQGQMHHQRLSQLPWSLNKGQMFNNCFFFLFHTINDLWLFELDTDIFFQTLPVNYSVSPNQKFTRHACWVC